MPRRVIAKIFFSLYARARVRAVAGLYSVLQVSSKRPIYGNHPPGNWFIGEVYWVYWQSEI